MCTHPVTCVNTATLTPPHHSRRQEAHRQAQSGSRAECEHQQSDWGGQGTHVTVGRRGMFEDMPR